MSTEASLLLVLDAAYDAEAANEWFDADLEQWLTDIRRFAHAALARARELRHNDELEAALEEPAA